MQRIKKEYKSALKKAKDRAKIAEKKLFDLEKEKVREHCKVITAAKALGGMAALEKEKLDQI